MFKLGDTTTYGNHYTMKSNPNVKYSLQDKTLQVLQNRTQKQAAKVLGVSTRTIRRWKAGHVKKPIPKNKTVLNKRFTNDRRIAIRKGAPKQVKIIPPIKKRKKDYVANFRKQKYVNMADYISKISDGKTIVRFLIKEEKSVDYPEGKMTTGWKNYYRLSPPQILRKINRVGDILRVVVGSHS